MPASGSALPPATVGTSYTQTISATVLVPPFFFDGTVTLPPGLTVWPSWTSSSFTISGTPTSVGTFPVVVDLSDQHFKHATVTYTLQVLPRLFTLDPPYGSAIPDATVGAVYSQTFTVSGGTAPYDFAASSLPSGLVLTPLSGDSFTISGTANATAARWTPFEIQVTDATGATESEPYLIVVQTPWFISPLTLPDGQLNRPYFATLTLENAEGPVQWSVQGALPPGLTLGDSGDLLGTCQAAGSFSFNVTATDGMGDTAVQSYTVNVPGATVTISPATLLDGTAGGYYSQSFTADGVGPIQWSVSGSLPDGLSLDVFGDLSGWPTSPGTWSFTITATDAQGSSGSQSYSMNVD